MAKEIMDSDKIKYYFRKLLPYGVVFFCFGLFLFIMAIFIDSYLLPDLLNDRDTIEVPDVSGKTLAEAEQILDDNKLQSIVVSEQFNENVPGGTVINQSPQAGKTVKTGRRINLTISKGTQNIQSPNIVGLPLRAAKIKLLNAGLKLGNITYNFSEERGPDTVIAQSLQGGNNPGDGASIDIIVSKGSEQQVMVPNLLHADYDNVAALLAESGLVIGEVTWKEGEGTFISNTVVGQSPDAGELVAKSARINITVIK